MGYVIHMLRFNDYVNEGRRGSDSARDRTRLHLLIDLIISYCSVFFGFAFPKAAIEMAVSTVLIIVEYCSRLVFIQCLQIYGDGCRM